MKCLIKFNAIMLNCIYSPNCLGCHVGMLKYWRVK